MDTFQDQVIIVTGASSGIGRSLAIQLAKQGANIILAARDEPALDEVANQCKEVGGNPFVIPTDVGKQEQCQHLVEKTFETFGRIDVLVNNAGITMWAYFDNMQDLSPFEDIMRVNYLGAVYCTHFTLPYLKQTNGRLVAVSSLAGLNGVPTRSGYAASKHAMVGFFESLRIELADTGVTTTMIYPGFVATEIRKRAVGEDGQSLGESPIHEDQAMSPEAAAETMVKSIANRDRELVMTMRGKVGRWVKLIAPGLVDKIARDAIEQGR